MVWAVKGKTSSRAASVGKPQPNLRGVRHTFQEVHEKHSSVQIKMCLVPRECRGLMCYLRRSKESTRQAGLCQIMVNLA